MGTSMMTQLFGEFFGTMEEAKAVFEKALEKYKPLLTAKS